MAQPTQPTQHSRRTLYQQRLAAMRAERSGFLTQWQDIARHLLPYAGRFLVTDRNKGENRFNKLIDRAATRYHRTLGAGLLAGMTSPARPWFRLSIPDEDLMKFQPVRLWLNQVTSIMRVVFERSNTYRGLQSLYGELGAFGTGVSLMLDDYKEVLRHYTLTAGEYMLAVDDRNEVNTLYREFQMTVAQMVSRFGYEKCTATVKNMFNAGNLNSMVPVVHLIEPRADRDLRKLTSKNMPFASVYYEAGADGDNYLSDSGFKRFRVLAPRWEAVGNDVYGNGPGQEALGLVKQLQHEQKRKALGIDYQTLPAMQAPGGMKHQVNMLPGGFSYDDTPGGGGGAKPMFESRLDLSALQLDIQDIRQQLRETFYADLFLMMAQDDRSNITAREVAERHEEKLIMLGPVLERLHNELLKPKIDITFDRMLEANIVPPPPQELQGVSLDVEFVSMLAQAQRAIGVTSIDKFVFSMGQLAIQQKNLGYSDTVFDKVNTDFIADEYGDMLGVDPNLIIAGRDVAIVRTQRAQAIQQMQQAAAAQQAAEVASTMGNTPTQNGSNALTDVISQFSGYGGPGIPPAA